MNTKEIALSELAAHPGNSNVMPADLLVKLTAHIERTGQYPPIIVRPWKDSEGRSCYQILDGHHRVLALQKLGRVQADCVVWEADDRQAMVLLATLNRLQGRDDVHKRATLVAQLREMGGMDLEALSAQLPEGMEELEKLLAVHDPPQRLAVPQVLEDMPVSVHFFLQKVERSRLEARLKEVGGSREQALMVLVDGLSGKES